MNSTLNSPEQTNSPRKVERYVIEERCKSGAHWFYWVAALSLVASAVSLLGDDWAFIFSLGITQVDDAFTNEMASEMGVSAKVAALASNATIAGVFALVGYLAANRFALAFLAGTVAYALDGLIVVVVGDWLAIGFHLFALYGMYRGFRACAQLAKMDENVSLSGELVSRTPGSQANH